jgi:hypothetical protein
MPKAAKAPRVRPTIGPELRDSRRQKALILSGDVKSAVESIQKQVDVIAERNSR